jgi:hypothetical protein
VELEDVTTSETESISPTRIEEEISTTEQVQVGQSMENPNDGANPNPENPAEVEEMDKQKQKVIAEEVLVEDITGQQEIEGEEEEEVEDEVAEENPVVGQKRKAPGIVEITLPYLPDVVVAVEDMLGKVPKLKYADHDVTDTTKFPDLAQEIYLENRGEVGPLGKPILEPAQWITGYTTRAL